MYELQEVVPILENLDTERVTGSDIESKVYFQDTLDYYNKLANKLKILLEAYFEEEKKAGLPAAMIYYKVYSKLTKA